MKLALIALMLICGAWKGWADDKYYVQLIKATNEPKAPAKGAKQIGANLGERLSPLRWKYYWEVQRRETILSDAKSQKVQLNGDRAIEIAPRTPVSLRTLGNNSPSTVPGCTTSGKMCVGMPSCFKSGHAQVFCCGS